MSRSIVRLSGLFCTSPGILVVLVTLCLLAHASPLHAASGTWTGATDGTWAGANWTVSPAPGSTTAGNSTDVATFNNNVNTSITVGADRYIGQLTFGSNAGAFTIGSGTLFLNPASGTGGGNDLLINAGAANNITINANVVAYRSTLGYFLNFTNNSSGATLIVNGTVTGGSILGSNQLEVFGVGNTTLNGVISNGNSALTLLKRGSGTLTLTGVNTYTGTTSFGDGNLTLDFTGGSSPASNIVSSSSALLLGRAAGGEQVASRTLSVVGKANTATSQTFNGFTMSRGSSRLNLSTSGSGTVSVALGAITNPTRANGTTLDIGMPAGTSVTSTMANQTNGALPQFITINGINFTRNDGSNNVVAFTAYTANTSTTLGTNIQIVDMSGGNTTLTATGSTTIGGLRFNNASATTITLDPARIVALSATGILITPNVGQNLSKITGGLLSGLSTRDLVIGQNNTLADLQIDSIITNNSFNGSLGLTKSGAGRVVLTGTNTYSQATYLNEGTLVVTADPTVGNTQSLTTTLNSATINGVDTTGLFIGQRVFGANINSNNAQGFYITAISGNTITMSGALTTAGTADVIFGNSGGLGYYVATDAVQVAEGATLQIGNNTATGGLVANQGIQNLGTVAFARTNDYTFNNRMVGTGGVLQGGSGKTILPTTQFYGGNTVVNEGTLQIDGDAVAAQTGLAGTRAQGSAVITGMADTSNLRVGQPLSGSGVATNLTTQIVSIDSPTQITMSAAASSNNTSANLAFGAGSATGTGAVLIGANGRLAGTGIVRPTGTNGITGGGIIAPGASIGTLTFDLSSTTGTVAMLGTGSFEFELGAANEFINSIAPGSSDLLSVIGASAGDFAFNDNVVNVSGGSGNGFYRLFSTSFDQTTWWNLTVDGTTGLITSGLSYPAGNLYMGGVGNSGDLGDIYIQVVPEPASLALLLGAGLGLEALRRRRSFRFSCGD